MEGRTLGVALRRIPLASILILLAACSGSPSPDVLHRPGEPLVVSFADGDAEMGAAVLQARATFAGFAERLPTLAATGAHFSVKVPIPAGAGTEHVWLGAVETQNGQVRGTIDNVPVDASRELGDVVSVSETEISDWMAVVDGRLYGGFTVHVIRARLSEAERAEFDRSAGFEIPPTPRHF